MRTPPVDEPTTPTKGVKYDAGKLDWTLVPFDALEGVVRVLQFGERKYARDNWKIIEDAEARYHKATLRHLFAMLSGEERDAESGELHIDHAITCLLFARWHHEQPKETK